MSEAVAAESAGLLLRRAREAAGLHVAALAVSLKVPVRKLEALEADRYDELTDAVFARALAFSVCRTLKVDAAPILERLPQTSAPRLVQDREGLNAPFRAPGDPAAPGWADQLTRPAVVIVFLLLLGALVLILLPSMRRDEPAAAAPPGQAAVPTGMTTPALPPVPAASEIVPVSAPTADAAPAPQAAATTTVPVAAPVAGASAPVAAAKPSAAASSAPAPAAASAAQPAASAPAATGLVVFRTTAPSWIEVMDARGNVALRRLMAAGESAGASGPTPLTITVGSASTTSVEVRGKPFALKPFIVKDNVARFEIK